MLCLLGGWQSGRAVPRSQSEAPAVFERVVIPLLFEMGYGGSRADAGRNSVFNESEGTGSGVADRFAGSAPTFEVGDHPKLVRQRYLKFPLK
jgi:hypothetical protein